MNPYTEAVEHLCEILKKISDDFSNLDLKSPARVKSEREEFEQRLERDCQNDPTIQPILFHDGTVPLPLLAMAVRLYKQKYGDNYVSDLVAAIDERRKGEKLN